MTKMKDFLLRKVEKVEEEVKEKEKKEKILNFIENNSSKIDFIHYLLNNTKGSPFNEEDSWKEIKEKIIQTSSISYGLLRNYAINLKGEKILTETIEKLIKEREETQEIAKRIQLLGNFKKFSILIGGSLIFLGIIEILAGIILVIEPLNLEIFLFNPTFRLGFISLLLTAGIFDLLGGVLLSVM